MTLGPSMRPARLRPVRILLLAAALAVPGCAAPLDLDSGTGAALQEQVASVRSALAGGDHAEALTTLDTLAADVERAAAEGKISPERKTRILHAIARIRGDALAAIPPEPATPAPAPTEAPDPAPSPSQQDDKKDEAKDRDKEKDRESGKRKADEEKDKGKGKD
jgi:hypothetical protein